jgi:hypothetical protein
MVFVYNVSMFYDEKDITMNIYSKEKQRNMMGTIRKFDKENHKKNDKKGKDAFMNFINPQHKNGNRTINNPNEYGIDLLTLNKDDLVIMAWEIELREYNWRGDVPFPHKEINCLERKEYMWRREKEFYDKIPFSVDPACKLFYVQLNDICSRAVIIPSTVILKYNLQLCKNSINEYIRPVPIEKTLRIRLSIGG